MCKSADKPTNQITNMGKRGPVGGGNSEKCDNAL